MSKRISKLQKAKNLIKKGHSNKYIFDNFPTISRQTVYNARWLLNKEKGIATLPKPEAVAQGTGIASAIPLQFEIIDRPAKKQSNARRNAQLARRARERAERQMQDARNMASVGGWYEHGVRMAKNVVPMTYQAPIKPTLWQRIKGFFVGA